jgi:biopolymer transport protein ExbD
VRFPRNTRIFRGQLDVAPYAGVFFLLVIFLLLNSSLVFVPGVPINLPQTETLPGLEGPAVVVAVDETGRFYFDNQLVQESSLVEKLRKAMVALTQSAAHDQKTVARKGEAGESVTLVVKADAKVEFKVLARLWLLAREAGITNLLQATSRPLIPSALPAKP